MNSSRDFNYKIQRECARQWRMVVASITHEISTSARDGNFHELGLRVGIRYATLAALPPCSSLKELEEAISARWKIMDWGWTNLDEQGKNLLIVHHNAGNGSLHASGFGEQTRAWAPAFLCGAYQQWLASLGAGDKLRVSQVSDMDELGTIEFQLGL